MPRAARRAPSATRGVGLERIATPLASARCASPGKKSIAASCSKALRSLRACFITSCRAVAIERRAQLPCSVSSAPNSAARSNSARGSKPPAGSPVSTGAYRRCARTSSATARSVGAWASPPAAGRRRRAAPPRRRFSARARRACARWRFRWARTTRAGAKTRCRVLYIMLTILHNSRLATRSSSARATAARWRLEAAQRKD